MFDRTLFVLVSCCLEEGRTKILQKVVANLISENSRINFFNNLMVFDNGSTVPQVADILKKLPNVYRSDENVGYWSALNWSLNNYQKIFNKNFDFFYVIESDLLHYKMEKLMIAQDFLDKNPDVGSVRTQKFSVFWKILYRKGSFLSSWTHDSFNFTAIPTGEKMSLEKSKTHPDIYITNMHAKLVGLNRMELIKKIFSILQTKDKVTELDFFTEYFKYYKKTAMLNGGIFTEKLASRLQRHQVVTGSHITNQITQKTGYMGTRISYIKKDGFNVTPFGN